MGSDSREDEEKGFEGREGGKEKRCGVECGGERVREKRLGGKEIKLEGRKERRRG